MIRRQMISQKLGEKRRPILETSFPFPRPLPEGIETDKIEHRGQATIIHFVLPLPLLPVVDIHLLTSIFSHKFNLSLTNE